jgi:F-type H+-transporting ATPase subunit b
MNNLSWILIMQSLIVSEGSGGLFDFNGTLPLIGFQFILLTVLLTFIFYKPVAKVLDEREAYIRRNLANASLTFRRANVLTKECDERLKLARADAKLLMDESERKAKAIVAKDFESAINLSNSLVKQELERLEIKKAQTAEQLENKETDLRDLLIQKVLGNSFCVGPDGVSLMEFQ